MPVLRADSVTCLGNDCTLGILSPLLDTVSWSDRPNCCETVSIMSQIAHFGSDVGYCGLIVTDDDDGMCSLKR